MIGEGPFGSGEFFGVGRERQLRFEDPQLDLVKLQGLPFHVLQVRVEDRRVVSVPMTTAVMLDLVILYLAMDVLNPLIDSLVLPEMIRVPDSLAFDRNSVNDLAGPRLGRETVFHPVHHLEVSRVVPRESI